MNVSDIKDRIYRLTSNRYTDSFHMLALINRAQGELVEGARLRGKQVIPTVSGQNTYALPIDFKSPGVLQDETEPDAIALFELVDISENRCGYAIEAGNIVIKPVPSEVRNLTHYYYKYATELVEETDVPEVDSPYHDLLAVYAAGMILLLPEIDISDKTLSDRLLRRWDDGKMEFIASMQRKNKASRGRTVNLW